ncbi:hypothetical protein CDL12_11260 [Handroanthus impetiginosus]|uniref:Uncharacterized protein n=1 Tax=Handroanthus impetiginosus TaxID=429701 RepID=A0A2G9HF76_9LAMI|nr:hypothetical protein CDL12_11260 [Handroanthus impetiginosus]
MDASPPAFEANGRDECWKPKVVDDFSVDKEYETENAPGKDEENGFLQQLNSWEKDADALSFQTQDKENEQRNPEPEHESYVTGEEFRQCNGSEPRDSSSSQNAASDLSNTEANLFTDKNVLECEIPELDVCYKEVTHHIVKDICVDEGRPEKDKSMIESSKDDKSDYLFAQPPNDSVHYKATEASLLESANVLSANRCGSNEGNDDELVAQGRQKSSSEDSVQTDEANCGATGKSPSDSSEEVSLVDRELTTQGLGSQSFLGSFLNTLDAEGDKVTALPDQISNGKAASESPESSAEAGGSEEDVQTSSLLYNRKVESGSITFNFNSEHVDKQQLDSGDVHDHKDAHADNLTNPEQVQCTSSSIENLQEQSLIVKGGNPDGSSATSHVHEQSPECKDGNTNGFPADGPVQFPANTSQSSANDEVQGAEPNVVKHEQKSSNVSLVNQLQYDEGETSFSQAGLVTYSGPIAYSGSLSYRSDGSATSGRSFAFPVLQSEWNSSPVRMAKADRKHLRKHKGWRSGLLCCRF